MSTNELPECGDETDHLDPRLGGILEEFTPTAAERARVQELAHDYLARDRHFYLAFKGFREDHDEQSWPRAFLALLECMAQHLIGAIGEELAVARLAGDVVQARREALGEAL